MLPEANAARRSRHATTAPTSAPLACVPLVQLTLKRCYTRERLAITAAGVVVVAAAAADVAVAVAVAAALRLQLLLAVRMRAEWRICRVGWCISNHCSSNGAAWAVTLVALGSWLALTTVATTTTCTTTIIIIIIVVVVVVAG